MNYSLSLMWLEWRIVQACICLIYVFCSSVLFSQLLRTYFEDILSSKCKLPVRIDDVSVDIWRGECVLSGVRLLHPPFAKDTRWTRELMMAAKAVTFKAHPFVFVLAFVLSRGKHLVFDEVSVNHCEAFVEAFVGSNGAPVLNLKLIGGEFPTRKRLRRPTSVHTPAPPPSPVSSGDNHLSSRELLHCASNVAKSRLAHLMSTSSSSAGPPTASAAETRLAELWSSHKSNFFGTANSLRSNLSNTVNRTLHDVIQLKQQFVFYR